MKKTQTLYIVSRPAAWVAGGIEVALSVYEPDCDDGRGLLGSIEVEYDVPDRESAVLACVDSLQKQKEVISAEAVAKKTAIDAQIQSLLAIEHSEVA